ncbi:unnamed protein product [Miscanthus lutarioriparius]|uniref:Transmembrane protein n=1 Tax=Miscanthus lutarioriparius TaxID=422564 RepID=A0A811S653_9POAL|nr:unnamed protein product [Miscanthus lutarioriparius]
MALCLVSLCLSSLLSVFLRRRRSHRSSPPTARSSSAGTVTAACSSAATAIFSSVSTPPLLFSLRSRSKTARTLASLSTCAEVPEDLVAHCAEVVARYVALQEAPSRARLIPAGSVVLAAAQVGVAAAVVLCFWEEVANRTLLDQGKEIDLAKLQLEKERLEKRQQEGRNLPQSWLYVLATLVLDAFNKGRASFSRHD